MGVASPAGYDVRIAWAGVIKLALVNTAAGPVSAAGLVMAG